MAEFEFPEHYEEMIKKMIHRDASYPDAVHVLRNVMFMKHRVETGLLSAESVAIVLAQNGFDTRGAVEEERKVLAKVEAEEREREKEDKRVVARTG